MLIDPLTGLAFAVQSQPGVYAVLVGSGVSRAAQIPTGWGITNDLIRRLAAAHGATITGEPADWYHATYGTHIGFSDLLTQLAPSRSDRRAILAGYIEPLPARPDERRPTAAHRALARFARDGHVRVFLTTNFDRLLEQAMTDAGISPLVVASPAQAAGAPPFHQTSTVVFKLHGDYLDPDSMLVTEDELASYDPSVGNRLSRVLEEYGLVICGWSGDWDPALRDAIASTSARRYPLYLASIGTPSASAASLVTARVGVEVPIMDADTFFEQLGDRVEAVGRLSEPHPLDTVALVGAVKASLGREEKRIALEDLVIGEANRVHDLLSDGVTFPSSAPAAATDATGARYVMAQAHQYRALTMPVVEVLVAGATWGGPDEDSLWTRAMNRIAKCDLAYGGSEKLLNLRRLPALLCVYGAGLAAVDRSNFNALRAVSTDVIFREVDVRTPLIGALHLSRVVSDPLAAQGLAFEIEPGRVPTDDELEQLRAGRIGRKFTPVSIVLHAWLREPLRATIPDDADYTANFDRLEMLLALLAADVKAEEHAAGRYTDGPAYGSFTWRYRYDPDPPETKLFAEYQAAGSDWGPLAGGLFGGSEKRAQRAFATVTEGASGVRSSQH